MSDNNNSDSSGDSTKKKRRRRRRKRKRKPKTNDKPQQPQTRTAGPQPTSSSGPQTVSVGGKRRRSRRRRRGTATNEKMEILSARSLTGKLAESRGSVDAWLPPDALPKHLEIEYRVTVRPTSIAVMPVVQGTRNAVPIQDALVAFNAISPEERPLFRALSRHVLRGKPATSEIRGEDAGEVLSLLEDARVILEPASMELRFSEEAIKPRIELDMVGDDTLRSRVNFYPEGSTRKFHLSSGAWFEGTPCWHIDVAEGVARPVDDCVTPVWLKNLRSSPTLVHPLSTLDRLLADYIPRVAAALETDLPNLEDIADLVDAEPTLQIWANGDIADSAAVVKVVYGGLTFDVPVQGFPNPLHIVPPEEDGARPKVIRRHIGAELNVVQTLMNHGFKVDEDRLIVQGQEAIDFWSGGITELPQDWERYVPDDLAEVKVRSSSVTAKARVSSGVDWLSLDMVFGSGDAKVSTEELRACLESGRSIVKLEDGTYAPVDRDQVGELLARMAEIYANSDGSKVALSQAGRVQSLLGMVEDKKMAPKVISLFKKLEDVEEIPQVAQPKSVKATLRPYQQKGFNWLAFIHDLGSGGILADDMGLGKTLQTITLLAWVKARDKDKRLNLVVAPTSVVPNWQREFAKFSPKTKSVVWQGPKRFDKEEELKDADIMFTSYALLRRDEEFLAKCDFKYIVLDEAQHIKNPQSHTAKAAKRLKSERRLALTGTPIENRLSELWSLFDFASPGLLGDLKTFEERIARPIDRGDDEIAAQLRDTIKPFVLRRLKTEVAEDLPEKIEQQRVVGMSDEQAALYKQTLQEVRKSLLSEVEKKGVSKSQIQILAALTRLRQVACDPRLMKLENQDFGHESSGKLEALRELVANATEGGHRVLIFSQFVTMLGLIRDALEEDEVTFEYLDGSTKDRMARVDKFNEDESIKVFLISLKAGGTGLNLTGADTVVHFDPWWNPAVEDQATDRAHRIGQTNTVNVYRLITEGTVEEKILELSEKKRALMENVLSTEGSPLKGLTRKDVDKLFS